MFRDRLRHVLFETCWDRVPFLFFLAYAVRIASRILRTSRFLCIIYAEIYVNATAGLVQSLWQGNQKCWINLPCGLLGMIDRLVVYIVAAVVIVVLVVVLTVVFVVIVLSWSSSSLSSAYVCFVAMLASFLCLREVRGSSWASSSLSSNFAKLRFPWRPCLVQMQYRIDTLKKIQSARFGQRTMWPASGTGMRRVSVWGL